MRPVGVVVMAKEPRPSQVKTRLCPPLTQEEAASLYAAMLADRCEQVRGLEAVIPAIAFANGESDPLPCAHGFERVEQPAGGLGTGLRAAAEHYLSQDIPVVLVDSDSPTLPRERLQQAVDAVRDAACDVVIGPAEDGGYYLIGLSKPGYEVFEGIPWSTAAVTSATLARAAEQSLAVHQLQPWWDVDDGADLERLDQSLLSTWWPHHTAGWLRQRRLPPTPTTEPGEPDPGIWHRPWSTLSRRAVYSTPWLRVREDRVRAPSGEQTTYSVVECGRCVGVLPFVDADTVLLVRPHRYVAGRVPWEMPTGGVHPSESPLEAAHRELAEEAQVHALQLAPLGAYHTSKSVMDETAHLYTATGLTPCQSDADDEFEFLRAEPVAFAQVLDWVLSGEIVDSMTIIAVLRVALTRAAG